jgi:LAO/AO transport system kinase
VKVGTGSGLAERERLPITLFEQAISGNRRSLAKLLTAVENGEVSHDSLGISPREVDGSVIGVTGAPGVGKSCLIDRLLTTWTSNGLKIAVIAVDPSSPLTGGALLGDRVRMESADNNPNVFVRSFATRNQPGGMPNAVVLASDVMRHCDYDVVLIETVGAGQSEIRVVSVADRIVLVEAPLRGDEVQAEKAGVIELADMIVVNKSDLEGSSRAAANIISALEVTSNPPPVLLASAKTADGIQELADQLRTLPVKPGAELARARERLLTAWDSALLSREDINEVLDSLANSDNSAQEWVEKNLRW